MEASKEPDTVAVDLALEPLPEKPSLNEPPTDEVDTATQKNTLEEEQSKPPATHPDDKSTEEKQSAKVEAPKELTAKQKKKLAMKERYKNRPKSKSAGKPKPTGFEEYFTEGPMTPDDYYHEEAIYDPDRPALFRLQEALSRYQQKRRLLSDRMHMFVQYLRYGGVDVGAKMFGGVSERELKEWDKERVIAARSQTSIDIDKMKLKIDFELVVKGFLTSYFPDCFNPDDLETIQMATVTIKNWLNYLLYHGVVSEYTDNIKSAIRSCDLAEKQLWDNHRLLSIAPGDFNRACSFLFGGYYYDPQAKEMQSGAWERENLRRPPMTDEIANKVIKFAIACTSTDEQASRFNNLTKAEELCATFFKDIDGFEVTEILVPEEKVRNFYKNHGPDLNPIGKVHGKAWRNPNGAKVDLAPGEELPNIDNLEFEFLVEEALLQYFYKGMKIVTTVWELNCGVCFYDEIFSAYCSFYTVLFNDLMLGWKEPRVSTKEEKSETGEGQVEKADADTEEVENVNEDSE